MELNKNLDIVWDLKDVVANHKNLKIRVFIPPNKEIEAKPPSIGLKWIPPRNLLIYAHAIFLGGYTITGRRRLRGALVRNVIDQGAKWPWRMRANKRLLLNRDWSDNVSECECNVLLVDKIMQREVHICN